MTVSTEVTRVIVEGNAVTTTFAYTFPIPGSTSTDQTNAELILTDTNSVSTTLANNLWSITGIVHDITDGVGGTFTYPLSGSPVSTGSFLTLNRIVPYTQETELTGQGAYSPAVVMNALDNLALQTEQLNTRALQSVRAPITDAALSDLPTADLRANSFLFFDDNGDVTTASSTGGMPTSILVGTDSTHAGATVTLLMTGSAVNSIVTADGVSTATLNSGLVLLESHTASASATIDFTTGISSSYDDYLLEIVGMVPSANNTDLQMQFGTSTGPSWSTGTYYWLRIADYVTNASPDSTPANGGTSADTKFILFPGLDHAATGTSQNVTLRFQNLTSSTLTKSYRGQGNFVYYNSGTPHYYFADIGGFWLTVTAVTGIRFIMSSGTITSGVFRLYGLAKT